MQRRDLSYSSAILLIFIFLLMLGTGLIQVRFELHRFIYHIYGASSLIILAIIHVFTNWRKLLGFIKNKTRLIEARKKVFNKRDFQYIISIALIPAVIFTIILGFLQVKLNFPRTRFVYHIYSAYLTLTLALIHIYLNLKKINIYLKNKSPSILLSTNKKYWKQSLKRAITVGASFVIIALIFLVTKWPFPEERIRVKISPRKSSELSANKVESSTLKQAGTLMGFDMAMKYHEKTKHTYAEVMTRTGGLNWTRQPTVFKKYPQAELIKLSTDFDFDSINVEKTIKMGPFGGSFSEEAITKEELSLLLYYTNGVTGTLRYPGLTYYLRASPSAGALYPTVIYLVVNNVEGLRKGVYHYSVKDHALHFLKEGDFMEELSSWCNGPSSLKRASVIFIMSAIFYRTKWKYRERGYRYVLLDTGHVGGNLTLIARALDLGSYSIGTFLDDQINQMIEIDGLKEAVVYINAVGRKELVEQEPDLKMPVLKKAQPERLPEDLTIAELIHENGKLDGFVTLEDSVASPLEELRKSVEVSYKNYPQAKKIHLSKEFSKRGLNLDDAIRKRRSARDYSGKPISESDLSRLLYYSYGYIGNPVSDIAFSGVKRAARSIEGLYPIELYVVVNNVEGIARGIYHYNALEHTLELLKEGDYRFRITNACLGQELAGSANIAIIKTAVFERVKHYGDRGYRYIHLDAGVIGENIYLEAISMGLGVCGIGAFFDDQINEMLGIDDVKESVIYVTSVGRLP